MNDALMPLLVAVPLAGAGLSAFGRPGSRWPLALLGVVLLANLVGGAVLLTATADGTVLAHSVGAWPAGIAIPFVGDALSALMITVTALLTGVCAWFAVAAGTGRLPLFAPLVMALTAGVNGALLTADLFNLFVFVEVMLLPSYGLLILSRRREGTAEAVTGSRLYVTFNLFVSTVLLAGIALVYGTAGTVNLAELAGAAAESSLVAAATAVCLFAFAMKAAVAPSHGWLARTYPSTSPAVTALFSGLHTKVAIYAIYRIYAVVFDGDDRYLWIGIVMFSATMLVGVLGAVGEDTMRSILSFNMISGIGYVLVGVALFTPAGLAAGLFYLVHHMIAKASLLLSAGAVETHHGTGRLDDLRGLVRRQPLLAAAFGMAALSLAGLPPFSGFVAKLSLVLAAVDADRFVVVAIVIGASLLSLLSLLRIWNAVFAGPRPDEAAEASHPASRTPVRTSLVVPSVVLAVVTLGLGLGAEVLLDLTSTAAAGLLDTTPYVTAVVR
ncbi:putative monovalent cation/H+ antiporter subunit D [Aeromicrobium marinum DSM 15272]|uniref:Monovalent cation/H+ antiporter subunit D n=1 Tax=Aeromicrobium marinum DSM 15272 TaxID=585531 RepID=E2SFZ6_9ACTN|nr:monovalent cation/H+ antiporter subunit D family protein [Aeromicrobium marinum]EFQ81943.1 putative monovalent cation/H+ antiporter subunit D [Aeromicrobium marinum DSM 15272]